MDDFINKLEGQIVVAACSDLSVRVHIWWKWRVGSLVKNPRMNWATVNYMLHARLIVPR